MDGLLPDGTPGKILGLWLALRKRVGVLEAKKKDGVRFKVRDSNELVDQIRDHANELGILIYPAQVEAKGQVVEDGTQADVTILVVAQAVEDGSKLGLMGYGQGADQQDKAGGKAGTYAFKAALVQALLAQSNKKGGQKLPDTDDSDEPIPGGVKPKSAKPKAPTVVQAIALMEDATDQAGYDAALAQVRLMQPGEQVKCKDAIVAAKARIAKSAPTA